MDNEHRKFFVVKQQKGCKFVPKMHKIRCYYAIPDPLAAMKGLLLRKERGEYGKKGRGRAEKKKEEGTGLTYKAMEGSEKAYLLRGQKGGGEAREGRGQFTPKSR